MIRFGIICNPSNRRFDFFKQAVISQGFSPPLCISYWDILQKKVDLAQAFNAIDVLKIESSGEDFAVRKELLALAATHGSNFISSQSSKQLSFDKGIIRHGRQEHVGFQMLLQKIQKATEAFPNLQIMNAVEDILLMLDKTRFHKKMLLQNIAVIPAIYNITSFEELIQQMKLQNWTRVFLKPNHGSSASGVIAFRKNGPKMMATTSIEYTQTKGTIKLYNSLKIHKYQNPKQIEKIVNIIAQNGIIVEKWISKSTLKSSIYDFRVVTTNQNPKHIIARQSHSPLTNLHLGNRRGNLELIKNEIENTSWHNLEELAKQTARAMPQTLYAGLDILISKETQEPYLIESNAFGDLLPNLLADGLDTYETQIQHYKMHLDA